MHRESAQNWKPPTLISGIAQPAQRFVQRMGQSQFRRATASYLWREHGIALLAYLILSITLTWPLVRNFTSATIGTGDTRSYIWMLWHTKEAVLGREPVFHTSLLYYPYGISLLLHSLGPITGLVVLLNTEVVTISIWSDNGNSDPDRSYTLSVDQMP